VLIEGRDVTQVPPRLRDVAMVFQNYALYPHMTVRENLGYGLRVSRVPKDEAAKRIDHVAALLGLEELLDRKPGALSGGQRQRTAMGRAIVREPKAFLMDEPLSNLDAKLRVSMRASLSQLHARLTTTTVYVTHDQTEAMTLGQRVAVMRDGRVQQLDTPQALYRRPANLFVAAFIGSPSMNLVEARLDDDAVTFDGYRFPLDRLHRPRATRDSRVILGIRPDDFELAVNGLPTIAADISVVEELGSDTHVIFPIEAPRLTGPELGVARETNDDQLLTETRTQFNARIDAHVHVQPGERLRLSVDPSRFHFFDVDTGDALQP
jgi:multiple sugar transport system ATP-binding protein